MKNVLKLSALALGLFTAVNASAAITVGIMSGEEGDVYVEAGRVAKQKFGLDVKFVRFNDFVTPNLALDAAQLDANAFQHVPYLEKQVKDRNLKLVPVGNTFIYPIAAYSKKIKSAAEVSDGATVAIPNDPTNLSRALLLIQAQGLIKLKDPKGLNQSQLDIVENPKHLKFQEIEAPLLPRVLPQVEFAVINTVFASQNNLFPTIDGIFVEGKDSPYVNIIAAREDNKDNEEIKQFVEAFHSDAVDQKAQKMFKGSVVKGW